MSILLLDAEVHTLSWMQASTAQASGVIVTSQTTWPMYLIGKWGSPIPAFITKNTDIVLKLSDFNAVISSPSSSHTSDMAFDVDFNISVCMYLNDVLCVLIIRRGLITIIVVALHVSVGSD